jgi:hypothetical protein
MKKYDHIEEVNCLFEMIKTIMITRLPQTKIKQLLREYTHSEIRLWKYINWDFIIKDKVYLD